MAYNAALTERIREALLDVKKVEEKRMFRGVTFMVNNKMCITVGDDKIMCRINPLLHDEVIQRKGCEAVIMKGREYKGYVYVHEDSIKREKDLRYWIGLALEFNTIAKASKKAKGKVK
jgi:TfoX/Sxy family transcriptional regulator of competence genes